MGQVSPLIPAKLAANCQNNLERTRWLNNLPRHLERLQHPWSLTIGHPFTGEETSCSWVAPVLLENNQAVILKLGMPHMEGEHEIEGLRFWAGDPTVQLLKADDEVNAMLLERCEPGTSLRELPETQQDEVIASLLHRLWREPSPGHPFRPLSTMTAYWSAEIDQSDSRQSRQPGPTTHPDAGLLREGLQLFKQLPQTASRNVLLATDLHAGNVLCAQREPWLVIDPKPFIGDPAYDATQHLLNCYTRVRAHPASTIRRFAGLLNLDYERVRLWTFARAAVQAGSNGQHARWLELARAIGNSPG